MKGVLKWAVPNTSLLYGISVFLPQEYYRYLEPIELEVFSRGLAIYIGHRFP